MREGTEGPYTGNGGVLRRDTPHEVATEVSLNTAFGVERVVRYAFERALARPRKHLTLIHKTNVLTHAGGLWSRTVEEVAAEFPEVTVAYAHVDAASMYFITDPGRFDVVVTDNLFGDIITDVGGGGDRRHRPGRQRQPRRLRHQPEHVRAGARLGPGHRRPGHRRPDGGGAVGRPAARAPGPAGAATKVDAAVAFDLSTRDPRGPVRTTDVGDRLAALSGG